MTALKTRFKVGEKVLAKNNYFNNEWREGIFVGTTAKRIKVTVNGIEMNLAPNSVKSIEGDT